jgi:predicted PurR-regulated permease PerM
MNVSFVQRVLFITGVVLLTLVFLYALVEAPGIFLLTFVGVLLAVFLRTVAKALPLPYQPALAVTVLLVVGVFAGFSWFVGPQINAQLRELSMQLPRELERVGEQLDQTPWGRQLLERTPTVDELAEAQENMLDDGVEEGEQLPDFLTNLTNRLSELLTNLAGALSNIFFVVFMSIFLAAGARTYASGVTRLFPPAQHKRVRAVLGNVYRTLQGWLLGQFIAMVTVGSAVGIGLWLLGVPLALGLGFLAFLFEFIPTIGPWLAVVPAVLIASSGGLDTALWVAGLFFVVEFLESNALLPLVQRWAVELPPALTLFSIFLMGALFGFLGILVAAPLAAVVLALVKTLYVKDTLGDKTEQPGKARS